MADAWDALLRRAGTSSVELHSGGENTRVSTSLRHLVDADVLLPADSGFLRLASHYSTSLVLLPCSSSTKVTIPEGPAEASAHAVSNSISLLCVLRPPRCSARTESEYTRAWQLEVEPAPLSLYSYLFHRKRPRRPLTAATFSTVQAGANPRAAAPAGRRLPWRTAPSGASVSTAAYGTAACAPEKA